MNKTAIFNQWSILCYGLSCMYVHVFMYELPGVTSNSDFKIRRSRHYLTLNISETVRDRPRYRHSYNGILAPPTQGCHHILNDLE